MFRWFSRNRIKELEEKTQEGFSAVKKDMDSVVKWIKHLNNENKQLFDSISAIKQDLSSIEDEVGSLTEGLELVGEEEKNKQLFRKLPILDKQTPIEGVQTAVQTAVQTGNFYNIFKNFSANEKLIAFTLFNSDMKLSYEDLALLLGKERSTIRGQINSIRQRSEDLIQEVTEKNGKKRLFISDEMKTKMQKYVKNRIEKR